MLIIANAAPAAAEDGARAFTPCRACHSLDPAERGLPGPNLSGLIGRAVAGNADFDYSPVLRKARDEGLRWDAKRLDAFLADPAAMFPGLWMSMRGIEDAAERQALVRFLDGPLSPLTVDGHACCVHVSPRNRTIMMAKKSLQKSLQLGRAVEWPDSPEKAQLDRVPNPQADTNYLVRFTAPEFTSICPVTGQPDFAHLMIDYVPGQWLLESKSLKLYVASFRNHGAFHEDCTVMIGKRIAAEIKPKWLRIGGYWYPRGGIPIDVFWQTGKLPKGMWVPDQGVAPYRGRG